MTDDPFKVFRSDDAEFSNPRYQRRIIAATRPIPIVGNMFDVKFDCGHEPLVFGDVEPTVGDSCFCPDCCEAAKRGPS